MTMGILTREQLKARIREADKALKDLEDGRDTSDLDDRRVVYAHLKSLCEDRRLMLLDIEDLRKKVVDLKDRLDVLENPSVDPGS